MPAGVNHPRLMRLRGLYMIASGKTHAEVALFFGIPKSTVDSWTKDGRLTRFCGLYGLKRRNPRRIWR